MPTKLAAYLMRGIVRPDDDAISLGVYPGWNYSWDYIWQSSYPQAATAVALGSVSFVNTADGRYYLKSLAPYWDLANFTGPNGDYYEVAWRTSDGLVLSAYPIGGPVNRGASAANICRLYPGSDGSFFGPLLDTKALGVPSGNTKRGELLFIGGYIQWTTIGWAVMLLDNTWNGGSDPDPISRNIKVLTDIPFSAWVMPPVGLTGNVVSEGGGAFANNVGFPAHTAGRTIKHAAIFVNTGNAATSEIARIITVDLAGAPLVTNGIDPIWLDFKGRPVLYFGVGMEPGIVQGTTQTPIVVSG